VPLLKIAKSTVTGLKELCRFHPLQNRRRPRPKAGSSVAFNDGCCNIHQAIQEVLPALLASLEDDERNVVLTLARMWRTLVTKEFVSKDIAAQWAAARLAEEQVVILNKARDAYLTACEEDWQNCQPELERTIKALHQNILANL